MSLDASSTQRTDSPISSGRTSPGNKWSRNRDDNGLLKKDKGYRRYASGVERVLSSFETTVEEWADYISFLGRLLKALQAKPAGIIDIPHKSVVSKRLSQCLNPILPSGVHQKTLEVYAYIFVSLSRDGLSTDLSLYLPGLTPILSFAALSVKPAALALFENHIVSLSPSCLRPALKAIILALLPCLEEESAEEFERTLHILATLKRRIGDARHSYDEVTDASGNQYFWQCLFLATITSTSRRPGALAYLTRNLPQLGESLTSSTPGSQKNGDHHSSLDSATLQLAIDGVASPEPGLLIRCFCAGLRDEQMLIQRGFLDLLVSHLPLHSTVLQEKVASHELERLISAAASVVARRDMSLNRRLWSWFLGPESSEAISGSAVTPSQDNFGHQSRYFEQYGLEPLTRTIRNMIEEEHQNPAERARPLRICLSLMDRWEIGGLVVPAIFMPAMKSVWRYHTHEGSSETASEVMRSAKMFFDGVESGLIWAEIIKVIVQAFDLQDTNSGIACDRLKLLYFIATNFNIREEEMLVVHMPIASYVLLVQVRRFLRRTNKAFGEASERVLLAMKIANKLLDLVPQRSFAPERAPQSVGVDQQEKEEHLNEDKLQLRVRDFYYSNNGNLDLDTPPLSPRILGQVLLQASLQLVTVILRPDSSVSSAVTDATLAVFNMVIRKVPETEKPEVEPFLANLLDVSPGGRSDGASNLPFQVLAAKVTALEIVCLTSHCESWIPSGYARQLIPALLTGLWPSLSPAYPKYNVEAARCMWRLQSVSTDKQLLESTISTLLVLPGLDHEIRPINIEDAQRFATLWTHSHSTNTTARSRRSSLVRIVNDASFESGAVTDLRILERPLMLLLDSLRSTGSSLFTHVVTWLQSIPSLQFIINLLIYRIALLPIPVISAEETAEHEDVSGMELCLYYLQILLKVLQFSPNNAWPTLESRYTLNSTDEEDTVSNAAFLAATSLKLLSQRLDASDNTVSVGLQLQQSALLLLRHLVEGPTSSLILELEIENPLLEELISSTERAQHQLQVSLMEVLLVTLRMRTSSSTAATGLKSPRPVSRDTLKVPSSLSISTDGDDRRARPLQSVSLPPKLLHCLRLGLTSRNSRPALDSWIIFLHQCLPLYSESIFQIIIPIVECFCNTLGSAFKSMQAIFGKEQSKHTDTFEPTLALLLNGLEQSLATAHDRLITDETSSTPIKSPEVQQQGFFGNMVSGVFSTETNRSRTMTANNRLTVLLCFKDAVRVCFAIWSWGDHSTGGPLNDNSSAASFNYTSLRLRNRTRRIFEHLFAAEALECLETLIELWQTSAKDQDNVRAMILNLLHVLDGSRPKNSIPAVFNAIYSRTNPSALDPVRKSTLTSNLSDISLAAFLVAYTKSLDDDAMDEIWVDCMTFLKDVLANPMPHRQTLPRLLEFTSALGEKVDNTNFGEQRKMRRELGDLYVRLLTATLTIRPMGFSLEATATSNGESLTIEGAGTRKPTDYRSGTSSENLIPVLAAITPHISKVLIDSDRIASTTAMISAQVIVPTIRSKTFPDNITERTLELIIALLNIPEAAKSSKKDVAEAFNDSKFFSSSPSLAQKGWLPILRQWSLADKDRMPELLSRLTSPTSAGIMFGVGATSARLEADRKTQLNLRRIACLILTATRDTFVINISSLQEKIVDLLNASAASSPSSTTRAEIYMVIRALLLQTSPSHLASFWPTINAELYDAISSAFPSQNTDTYNTNCLLHACKLLDTLLTLGLDDFQMQEWLFITDTADAVYGSSNLKPVAMVDELAEELDSGPGESYFTESAMNSTPRGTKRRPLLTSSAIKDVPIDHIQEKILRPFFRQLSIYAFESTYSMEAPDWKACFNDLVTDLFDDTTLV